MTSKPKHLHFAALLFFLYDMIKNALIPFIAGVFGAMAGGAKKYMFWVILAGVLLILGATLLKYVYYTYQLLDDEIVVKYGWIVKKVNHVPYDRIQNVTTNQWFFLKPFGLEELEIETAGRSDGPEVKLRAVPDSLKQEINDLRKSRPVEVEETVSDIKEVEPSSNANTYMISWHDLLKFSFTSPAFLTGFLVVLGLYGKVSNSINKSVYDGVAKQASHLGVLLIVALIVVVLILFYLGATLVLIAQYYHFKLTEENGQFVMERGFFQKKVTTITMDRVQAVMVKQTWLRSFLHIVTVQLVIVSNSKKDDSEKDIIVMPVIVEGQVNDFIRQFFPKVPVDIIESNTPVKRTMYYDLRNATYFALITAAIIISAFHSIVWLAVVLIILELLFWYPPAFLRAKRDHVQVLNDDFLMIRVNKILTKQTYFVPRESIQIIEKQQSVWLEKKHFAHLTVNCRSGNSKREIKVRYQREEEVLNAFDWYKGLVPTPK
ncbi:PH domain-containing protein [Companilactobacillus mishanensis]|uniref:YdbS-like PH domain-containing protein n=1 Tax=Companilactobacillus mishanensis TaxID=2486008 RepID=A0ABW9P7Q7_9LACO|nr:PH domain-containing protein [Companilactobacillus mishanensis]MQS45306.1 hypothetical protein [Companilactobacillus mishanensis]